MMGNKREDRANRRPADEYEENDDRYEDFVMAKRESQERRNEARKDRELREKRKFRDK